MRPGSEHPAAPEQIDHGFDEGLGDRPRHPANRTERRFSQGYPTSTARRAGTPQGDRERRAPDPERRDLTPERSHGQTFVVGGDREPGEGRTQACASVRNRSAAPSTLHRHPNRHVVLRDARATGRVVGRHRTQHLVATPVTVEHLHSIEEDSVRAIRALSS
jgi:hypothetical protein